MPIKIVLLLFQSVCFDPLCLTDLQVSVYKQKHLLLYVFGRNSFQSYLFLKLICKTKQLVKQNMPVNTPTDNDW